MSPIQVVRANEMVGFKVAGLRASFTFGNPSVRHLFTDGLQPYPLVRQTSRGHVHFDVRVDDAQYSDLRRQADCSGTNPTVLSYCTTEAGTVRAKVASQNDRCVLISDEAQYVTVLSAESQDVAIILTERYLRQPSWNRDLSKIVQHILTRRIETMGGILVHAAAVARPDGRALLIMGPKRAGKTTFFFDLCKFHGLSPVSVDKVWLWPKDGTHVTVYSVPTRLRALAGTLRKYDEEFADLIPPRYLSSNSAELWQGKSDGKVPVSYARFESSCGRSFVTSAQLDEVWLPRLGPEHTEGHSVAIGAREALAALTESLYSPCNPEEEPWLPVSSHHIESSNAASNRLLGLISTARPVIRLFAGSDLTPVIQELLQNGPSERCSSL